MVIKRVKKKHGEFHKKKHGHNKWGKKGKKGGEKGMDWYKDKGAKKHGWKNSYHKEEWGDNKKYHDVWRSALILTNSQYFNSISCE